MSKLTRTPAHAFVLHSAWDIPASAPRIWQALTEPQAWPRWWRFVRAVETVRPGDANGLGAVRRMHWSTRLPYGFSIEVETTDVVPLQRLQARSRGQLEGEGIWTLTSRGATATRVDYEWRVALGRPWMRAAAPLLAPVFRWNHHAVMRAGEVGLIRHLGG